MSRLIDADEAIDYVNNLITVHRYYHPRSTTENFPISEVIAKINEVPTVVDAVTVVRCIECKYASFSFHQGELYISCENNEGLLRDVPEDGYCYCGEQVTE